MTDTGDPHVPITLSTMTETLSSAPPPGSRTGLAAAERLQAECRELGAARFTASGHRPGTIRHLVLFRFKDGVSAAERAAFVERFAGLRTACVRDREPYVVSIEHGAQQSGEGADGGFEHAFLMTFRSEGDRNYYVGQPIVADAAHYDPVHQAFKEFAAPLLAPQRVLVFDYLAVAA
jgi:hypothetical protein